MPTAYIGIGSNLGNREENCEKAVTRLLKKGVHVVKRSSLYETGPWGVREQPKFINMAVEVDTELKPYELLKTLKGIESELGRTKGIRWGPRVIDLDILLYNDLIMKTYDLEIPHPHINDREFVLKPLSDIAPDKIHPVFKKRIKNLLMEFLESSQSERVKKGFKDKP
ncbi:MAG: 2-amino-4-hydroxy-6-hydroxymethyldihydropteridine diphosphokinase [Thermodesulfovibrionia bacterium]|nr:2-amino-4-hydroxy-6-hydroxymethyldihydropteridine diphosphokinase [Thermodesulfovibrionia bacterium]MCK5286993.1 2-amino-4-hydroxy-6-hydroxymethyldihydropteridine diphosphokinase [Thermodesulfovibrionia bacterium]MCK5512024.1 2-amino-4-hydroxy-6-hydroxymethyldihydropteridine diphosphokinase [Thermodesulfovibrionia bacterium]